MLVFLGQAEAARSVSLGVDLNQYRGFFVDYPRVVAGFKNDDGRGNELKSAAVCVAPLYPAASQKADEGMAAVSESMGTSEDGLQGTAGAAAVTPRAASPGPPPAHRRSSRRPR